MPVDVTFLRADDIPVLCAENAIDLGITGSDLLVVPVLADRTLGTDNEAAPDLDGIETLLDTKDFTGKKGQTLFVPTPNGATPETLLGGLGEEVDLEGLLGLVLQGALAEIELATELAHRVEAFLCSRGIGLVGWDVEKVSAIKPPNSVRVAMTTETPSPDGHPKSPTYGHLKIPHPCGPIS